MINDTQTEIKPEYSNTIQATNKNDSNKSYYRQPKCSSSTRQCKSSYGKCSENVFNEAKA